MYLEHIGWTGSKLITPIISLESSLLGATTSAISPRGTPLKFGWKKGGVALLRKPTISLKRGKIGPRYWWPLESRIRAFDWCQNQRPWGIRIVFKTRATFGVHHENLNEYTLYYQRRRCNAMTLDSDDIRFMRIFAVVLRIYVNFPDLCLRPYITYSRTLPFFVIKFNCFVYHSYYRPIRLRRVVNNGCKARD